MNREEISQMFDQTALSGSLDGIMGNGQENDVELLKIEELFRKLDLKGELFDGGVGVGRLIPLYQKLGFSKISGADFSAEMVKRCLIDHPDVSVYQKDLCDLSILPDNWFDVSVLMYGLIHIVDDDDCQKAVSEIERITKGEVIVGQVMESEKVGLHSGWCKVRTPEEIISMFNIKKVDGFYSNWHEVKSTDGTWTNKVSFLVMK